nr:cation-translocating P-type ATPase [Pseudomonadota bacterium]
PFDSTHKYMATFHRDADAVLLYVKGAPDVLLAHASHGWREDRAVPLDAAARTAIAAANETLAGRALRVLAVAVRVLPAQGFDAGGDLSGYIDNLTFLGLAGIIDPPRAEAREAIALCRRAGIDVKMITGDHQRTALAVARDLGLSGEALSGAELSAMDDAQLAGRCPATAVFARVAPEHKVRIVRALKARGQVVAMTGDGVNDAPALKNADIGVAMGATGTEVTREAAAMVLTDDNFATIVAAVREGRTIYDNIVKFVRFQLSTNVGAILTVAGAPLLGLPVPFTPIQILWINIIMDGPPAMTLGVDPPRPGLMDEPPRPRQASILPLRRLGRLLVYGITMAAGTLGVFYYALRQGRPDQALTLAFTTFVLFQFFNAFNARAEHASTFTSNFFSNGRLWLALLGVVLLQVLVVHWGPAQVIFRTTGLTLADWGLAFAVASSVLLLDEGRKLLLRLGRGLGQQAAQHRQ